ncbi:hypothetical protein GY12_20455 [Micrococcus luteus]|nr:hypothetical protein GY12_20455 [Micrococcus luteus]
MPNTKSFQAMKKAMIAVVKTPGGGQRDDHLAERLERGWRPSTCAAGRAPTGSGGRTAARVQMEIGRVRDRVG